MATTSNAVLQASSMSVGLTVDDLGKSMRFFEGLGFAVDERWEEGGVLLGVMMSAGAASIVLNQDDWKKGRDRVKGAGMRLFIATSQNIDEVAARARAAGIALDDEPHDTDFGTRAFGVTEPTGFKVTISSEIK